MRRESLESDVAVRPETKKLSKKNEIKARINRKISYIRRRLESLSKRTGSFNLLALEHPRYDKFHEGHNQEIKNLIGELKSLSDSKAHRELVRNLVIDLRLQSYCKREEP